MSIPKGCKKTMIVVIEDRCGSIAKVERHVKGKGIEKVYEKE